jgi:hypothetical protein
MVTSYSTSELFEYGMKTSIYTFHIGDQCNTPIYDEEEPRAAPIDPYCSMLPTKKRIRPPPVLISISELLSATLKSPT